MPANTSPLRVALVGAGTMGRHHLKAMAASPLAKIVGVADPMANDDELRPLLPKDAIVVGNFDELIARAHPDIVHIVTPPHTHEQLALQAIGAGCHVYLEKPFAPSVESAARILDAAQARGVKVCAGHQVLFEAPALAAMEHLKDIGRIVHIESYFSFRMVRRTITPVAQVEDILPHAVYPVVEQLFAATGRAGSKIEIVGMSLEPSGDVYALLRLGGVTAIVIVTLNGRPVEQYQHISGTNGSLRADYIGGFLDLLTGPGTGPGVLLTPYRRAAHSVIGTTRGVVRLVRGGSYPGLRNLSHRFYSSVAADSEPPLSAASILETVRVCERIGNALKEQERAVEATAMTALEAASASLPAVTLPTVVLTGGTGLLGRPIALELRQSGFAVRVLARRLPAYSRRIPGVEYVACDLARELDGSVLGGAQYVVHAAAETSGGKEDHRRNSIDATRRLVQAARAAGVVGFVHISSLGVLKTSAEVGRPLDEEAPVDAGNMKRGPYVWGKAESEVVARDLGASLGLSVRVIRPGPLVDYAAFAPPGRLGREVGPWFVGIGPKRGELSVCDVATAASVVRSYLTDFDAAPPVLNLVESPAPSRQDLLRRYRRERPDLKAVWIPGRLLAMLSAPLKLAQRVLLKSPEPMDIAAAFASERYDTRLAARIIQNAVAPRPDGATR